MITFRKMIYILIAIIIALSVAIVCISISFKHAKQSHDAKVGQLKYAIVQLLDSQKDQLGQLKLSDDLKEKLKLARETLDRDLLAMQYDFVETLSKNNLLDDI